MELLFLSLSYLVHGIREERLQAASLTHGFRFQPLKNGRKGRITFALGQHLEAVVVVPHVLLVDAQHRQQHVEEVPWGGIERQRKG